nr:hypothetical protein [uncultured Ligilactobacillus sp.]
MKLNNKLFVLLMGTALVLGGCGSSQTQKSSDNSDSKTKTEEVSSKAKKTKEVSSQKDNEATESSQAVSENSARQEGSNTSESSATENSTASKSNSVDTKNLTTEQANSWAYKAVIQNYSKDGSTPPMEAFTFSDITDDSGCLTIQVQENHQSEWMKEHNGNADTNPTVGWYRINEQGQLQKGNGSGDDWQNTNIPYSEN